jgi:hypothetical protein
LQRFAEDSNPANTARGPALRLGSDREAPGLWVNHALPIPIQECVLHSIEVVRYIREYHVVERGVKWVQNIHK